MLGGSTPFASLVMTDLGRLRSYGGVCFCQSLSPMLVGEEGGRGITMLITSIETVSLSLLSEGEACGFAARTELTSASVSARTVASLFLGILAVLRVRCAAGDVIYIDMPCLGPRGWKS